MADPGDDDAEARRLLDELRARYEPEYAKAREKLRREHAIAAEKHRRLRKPDQDERRRIAARLKATEDAKPKDPRAPFRKAHHLKRHLYETMKEGEVWHSFGTPEHRAAQLGKPLGLSSKWVRLVYRRIDRKGIENPKPEDFDARVRNGREAFQLKPELLTRLAERMKSPPPGGGAWTSVKVAQAMALLLGVQKVSTKQGWRAMRRLSFPHLYQTNHGKK